MKPECVNMSRMPPWVGKQFENNSYFSLALKYTVNYQKKIDNYSPHLVTKTKQVQHEI